MANEEFGKIQVLASGMTVVGPQVYIIQVDPEYDADDETIAKIAAKAKAALPEGSHVLVLPPGPTMRQTPYFVHEEIGEGERRYAKTIGFATLEEMQAHLEADKKPFIVPAGGTVKFTSLVGPSDADLDRLEKKYLQKAAAKTGMTPDPWLASLLADEPVPGEIILVNCGRQVGATTGAAMLAVKTLDTEPAAQVLVVCRTGRNVASMVERIEAMCSHEYGKRWRVCHDADWIRGQNLDVIIVDEAARIPDNVYRAIRPMLAAKRGRLIALSPPHGTRGWFHQLWTEKGIGTAIRGVIVPSSACPRISKEFLDEMRKTLTPAQYAQEFECAFIDPEPVGLIHAVDDLPASRDCGQTVFRDVAARNSRELEKMNQGEPTVEGVNGITYRGYTLMTINDAGEVVPKESAPKACTCPTADMLRSDWVCTCGAKSVAP